MGCDIHWYTERFTKDQNYDGPRDLKEERDNKLSLVLESDPSEAVGRWISADKWEYESYDDEDDPYEGYWSNTAFYRGKNYGLFELLAGVRGDENKAITSSRGVPEDCSFGYRTIVEQWHRVNDCDGHSFSYFTLSELLEIDWEKYREEYYLDEFLEALNNMKAIDSNYDNVRALFFFDN